MAITPYTQQIAVRAGRGVINPDLPVVRDDGGQLRELGNSLLASQEPRLRKEAQDAAEVAAGTVKLGVDANGMLTRPETGKKGGLVFREAFDRLLDNRYVDTVTRSQEIEFNNIAAANRLNPTGALDMMHARSDGVLAAVPEHLRPQVESILLREVAQRHGQVLNETTRHMAELVDSGNAGIIQRGPAVLSELIKRGAPKAEVDALTGQIQQAIRDRVAAKEMTAGFGQVITQGIGLEVAEAAEYSTSLEGMRNMLPLIHAMPIADLQIVGRWATGGGQDEVIKIGDRTITRADFVTAIPRTEDQVRTATIAHNRYSALDQEEQRADEAARRTEAATQQQMEDLRRAQEAAQAATQASAGVIVHTAATKQLLDDDYGRAHPGLTASQIMATDEGQRDTLARIQNGGGWAPAIVLQWMDEGITGPDAGKVRQLHLNLIRLYNKQGVPIGRSIESSLSPRTRAFLDHLETAARVGTAPEVAIARLMPFVNDNSSKPASIDSQKQAFLIFKEPGNERSGVVETYDTRRDKMIRQAMGLPADDVRSLPPLVTTDFDRLMAENMLIYGGKRAEALAASARQVSNGWARLPFFTSGVGPRLFAVRGIDVGTLDKIVGARNGASFANGPGRGQYLRLDPQTDSVEEVNGNRVFGKYVLRLFNSDGSELRPASIDMDVAWATWHQSAAGKAQQGAVRTRDRALAAARSKQAATTRRTVYQSRTVGSGPKM